MATQNFYRPQVWREQQGPRSQRPAWAQPLMRMVLTRTLAHNLQSRLQIIMSLVETGQVEDAVTAIHEFADVLNSVTETRAEERDRHAREAREHERDDNSEQS